MNLRLSDYEIQEWHEHVLRQRDRYASLLQDICCGVPKIRGMASEYRPLTLVEIKEAAHKLLEDK